MSKLGLFKNLSLILSLLFVVYAVANYSGFVTSTVMQMLNIPGSSVQGVSTQRAQDISGKIGSDVGDQVENARSYILDVKVADAVAGFARLQRVPKDVQAITSYTKEQVDHVLQSREKKEHKNKP